MVNESANMFNARHTKNRGYRKQPKPMFGTNTGQRFISYHRNNAHLHGRTIWQGPFGRLFIINNNGRRIYIPQ